MLHASRSRQPSHAAAFTGNVYLWGTYPKAVITEADIEQITALTGVPRGYGCSADLWYSTQTLIVFTYVMMAFFCCCCCCFTGMAVLFFTRAAGQAGQAQGGGAGTDLV